MSKKIPNVACPFCDSLTIPLKERGDVTCSECLSTVSFDASRMVTKAPSLADLHEANRVWRTRGGFYDDDTPVDEKNTSTGRRFKVGDYPNSPLKDMELDSEFGTPTSSLVEYCSFCHVEVAAHEITRGKLPFTFKKETIVTTDPLTIERKTVWSSKALVACPACSPKIAAVKRVRNVRNPDTGDWEKVTDYYNATVFPETEG